MRRAFAFAVVALVGAGQLAPAGAAPVKPTSYMTIRADRSARLTVTVTRPVDLLLGEPGDAGPVPSIKGGGKEAGFLLTPVGGGGPVGQLAVDGIRYSSGAERERVEAGRYLLRVVAEKPVVIRVPVVGRAQTWDARTPIPATRRIAAWDVPAGPAVVGGAPVTIRASSVVLFRLTFTAYGIGAESVVCLTVPNGVCRPGEGVWQAGVKAGTGPRTGSRDGIALFADQLPAGTHQMRWRITADGAVTSPAAFAYVID